MSLLVNCLYVTPGEPLNNWQILGLKLVSQLQGGRDVVLAFDLTGSVDFNDEGRTRLHQIVKDSLKLGDRVYVIPFASEVNPLNTENKAIIFCGAKNKVGQEEMSDSLSFYLFRQ
jgi:hypothetical protein